MRLNLRSPAVVGAGAVLLALGVAVSCKRGGSATSDPGGDGATLADSSEELKPAAQPGWKAVLVYLSTEIPVEVEHRVEGADVTIRLLSFGQEIEVERYRSTNNSFELVQVAGEKFDPPLPLLEFPLYAGPQAVPWKGKLLIGTLARDAEAKVSVKDEPLKAKGFDDSAIKVSVELYINGGAPKPAMRTLDFWFVEGKGLLKRAIDKGSSRIPAPPESGRESP